MFSSANVIFSNGAATRRGGENRRSHSPVMNFPNAIKSAYMSPRQIEKLCYIGVVPGTIGIRRKERQIGRTMPVAVERWRFDSRGTREADKLPI